MPEGQIQVDLKSNNAGVKMVKIKVNSFVKIDKDYTDVLGMYKMTKTFSSDPKYTIVFENQLGFKIWGNLAFLAPAQHSFGKHSNSGYDYTFDNNDDEWKLCTVNNAVYEYNSYCATYSVSKPPSNLRIWVSESATVRSGSAPMLRRTWGLYGFNTQSDLADFYFNSGLNLTATILQTLFKFAQPDITISCNSNYVGSDVLFALTFHECSHASHWSKVGSAYWIDYINYIITYGSFSNPYGNGTGENADICGIGEMWGNYFGNNVCSKRKFGSSVDWVHDRSWFNPGFIEQTDQISDVTTREVFDCLGSTTFETLVNQLKTKTYYDNQIDNAFNSYPDWP